jgi:hypothetical protein
MHLPLDFGPDNFLTTLTNAPNSRFAMCILSTYAELKTILSRSMAIRAEVRNRVHWTNVLVDPNVPVDIIFMGTHARFLFNKFTGLGVFAPAAIANFNPVCPQSKYGGANVII